MRTRLQSMKALFEDKAVNYLAREPLKVLQVNMGDLCNQECSHCHVGASPRGGKVMGADTVEAIIAFLRESPGLTLDITGGAPELNPVFRRLVTGARPHGVALMVRSNLTVLLDPAREDLVDFLVKNRVKIIASLPCYTEENVDTQRGRGVFEKSIAALRRLNRAGYGKHRELLLDLVYNPGGPFLPGRQSELETVYKEALRREHEIIFDHLITMTNAPIGRFARELEKEDSITRYIRLLIDNFNPGTLPHIMCRHTVSVDYRGLLYDCDFNQALGLSLRDEHNRPLHISGITAGDLAGLKITIGEHCFACTASDGSSCGGSLLQGRAE